MLIYNAQAFPFMSGNRQSNVVKDVGTLRLNDATITKDLLDLNRAHLVACAILLRTHYSVHSRSIISGLLPAVKLNHDGININHRFYFSNLEHCFFSITDDKTDYIVTNQAKTRKLQKISSNYFLANPKNIKKFIMGTISLSANQLLLSSYMQSDLDSQFSETISFFQTVVKRLDVRRAQLEKESDPKYQEAVEARYQWKSYILGAFILFIIIILTKVKSSQDIYYQSNSKNRAKGLQKDGLGSIKPKRL